MARLSRAELQEHNRAKVSTAARAEFTERGFRDAKIDQIAERAELTRGRLLELPRPNEPCTSGSWRRSPRAANPNTRQPR